MGTQSTLVVPLSELRRGANPDGMGWGMANGTGMDITRYAKTGRIPPQARGIRFRALAAVALTKVVGGLGLLYL